LSWTDVNRPVGLMRTGEGSHIVQFECRKWNSCESSLSLSSSAVFKSRTGQGTSAGYQRLSPKGSATATVTCDT